MLRNKSFPFFTTESANEKVAKAANTYARQFMKKGRTQPEFNEYPVEYKKSMISAVTDIRDQTESAPPSASISEAHATLYKRTSILKKFSLGNCEEFAFVAFEYILDHQPNIEAEIFGMTKGEHAFLVIGRDPSTDPNRPFAWGKDVWICDPWANDVYPAEDCLSKLEASYFKLDDINIRTNYTRKFNPDRHILRPLDPYSTRQLREYSAFNTLQGIVKITQTFENDLLQIKLNLEKESNTVAKEQLKIIENKILATQELFLEIEIEQLNHSTINFEKETKSSPQLFMKKLASIATCTPSESTILTSYGYSYSPKTIWMKAHHIPPKITLAFNTATQELNGLIDDYNAKIKSTTLNPKN